MTGPRFPLIDAHNHLGRWLTDDWAVPDVDALLGFMDAWGIEAMVNLDGRWGEQLDANLDRYDRAHPGRFATFAQLDWSASATPGFGSRLAGQVARAVDAGAKGLKVWKDLGLHLRDDRGALLAPDDERLGVVWEAAADAGVPVLIHTGDPAAFFEPMDETNERIDELRAFPEWWVGDRTRFPTFSELLGSFERMVGAHPATTFIGAHVAGAAEDLARVGSMLTSYPNLHVDVGARIAELGRRPDAARALMLAHPSRILFGTDEFPPAQEVYAIHVRFFESADEHFAYSLEDPPPQGRWSISGLELPDDPLRAIYRDNARRLIPGLGP